MDTSLTPFCSRCGSPMQLRQVRKGGSFWSCSRYPACDGKLDFAASSAGGGRNFPVRVEAAPRQRHSQCTFFQTCALPASMVEHFFMAEVDRALIRAVAQWRLDIPRPHGAGAPVEYRDILAVAETLLTRGTTPLCAPALEQLLGSTTWQFDDSRSTPIITAALQRIAAMPSIRFRPLELDSDEEHQAFERIHSFVVEQQLAWHLLPQVKLASLTPRLDPQGDERGDLLLVQPQCAPVLVEIDGDAHQLHRERDAARDSALRAVGIRVIRVPAREIRRGDGKQLAELERILSDGRVELPQETLLSFIIRQCKFFHQIQLALLAALRGGWLRFDAPWNVGVLPPAVLRQEPRIAALIQLAVSDLLELLTRLARLHGRALPSTQPRVLLVTSDTCTEQLDVLIAPADGSADALSASAEAQFLISDVCLPVEVAPSSAAATPAYCPAPQREDARWFLEYLFRKPDFREGQWETIARCLRGQDSIVLLPTGAGKSIAFQLAALLLPGRCIVIDPIISLIDDQIDNLARVGIDRCIGITHRIKADERNQALRAFQTGYYLFCYVAPERFQTEPFRNALRTLSTQMPISLIVVDEAHCVSEWGHDFRTAYLNLGRITREYCTAQGVTPPLIALTGTASKIVLKDVQRELGITSLDAIITPQTFDREELFFTVVPCRSEEKPTRVLGLLERLPTVFNLDRSTFFQPAGSRTQAGLVFCPHIEGDYGVVKYAERLRRALQTRVELYSGEAPKRQNPEAWEERKRAVTRDFKRNRFSVLVCTKAFGMGIDKPNIRYTIHIGLPSSIEAFYQEAGRAGRDRQPAECAIVLSNDDPKRSQHLLSPAIPLEQIAEAVEKTHRNQADDVIRALWFHVNAFRGVEKEVADIARLLDQLGDVESRRWTKISWCDPRWTDIRDKYRDNRRERAEKALHRLVVLGVVADYTVDFGACEFNVLIAGASQEEIAAAFGRYARAYQHRLGEQKEREARALRRQPHRDYILEVARLLVHFIYEHIEQARRRALNEMLQAASYAHSGGDLRRRILDYLEQSEWDERLESVRASARGGVDQLAPVLEDVVSPNDAAALRAAAGRMLASYPDVPGLLLLRGLSEALSPDANLEVARQNLEAAMTFALEKYQLEWHEVAQALGQTLAYAGRKPGLAEALLDALLASSQMQRPSVRALLAYTPTELAAIPARWLLNRLTERCEALLQS
ncbi:MAG: RecQ family ATP-dependent DNA helicase [Anaerolineae bacterium]|nr:RecQ family ATP-dependent DNA helicase [Anaerolineae bacterium]MDW8069843.1 RecQ family ATP-dependent DNA helicase [Anaerolineae bacterium]